MERILPLRKKIDEIDGKILLLLKERAEVCKIIGAIKTEHAIPIRNRSRELKIYDQIIRKSSQLKLDPIKVKAIYREIVSMCVHVQESKTLKTS